MRLSSPSGVSMASMTSFNIDAMQSRYHDKLQRLDAVEHAYQGSHEDVLNQFLNQRSVTRVVSCQVWLAHGQRRGRGKQIDRMHISRRHSGQMICWVGQGRRWDLGRNWGRGLGRREGERERAAKG